MVKATPLLLWSFVALALAVAAAFVAGVHRVTGTALRAALLTGVWMAATLGAAAAGVLRFDSRPPTMMRRGVRSGVIPTLGRSARSCGMTPPGTPPSVPPVT